MKSKNKNGKTNKKQVVEAEIVEKKVDSKDKKLETKVKKEEKKSEKKIENKKTKKKDKKSKKNGFFADVINELKKVKWPDKKYMIKYSIATFGTIILTCVYFSIVTALFALVKGVLIG